MPKLKPKRHPFLDFALTVGVSKMKKTSFLLATCLSFSVMASADMAKTKTRMLSTIDFLGTMFDAGYAPTLWKGEYANWNMENELQNAKNQIIQRENVVAKDLQFAIRDFLLSTQDYHVSYGFYATEAATLPFSVMKVQGKYYFNYIDRNKLSEDSFPFSIGDELVLFNDKPIEEEISIVKKEIAKSDTPTDQMLAELKLTSRRAARGMSVPRGTINIGVIPQGDTQVYSQQLIWEYTPELVSSGMKSFNSEKESIDFKSPLSKYSIINRQMKAQNSDINYETANPFAIGSKKSYLPRLGLKIWENDTDAPFDAYIYMTPDRKLIGYVRIAFYSGDGSWDPDEYVQDFAKIIARFEQTTDAMVIDQINNPGGSVFYLYSLVSMLTDNSVFTPRHKMAVNQNDVVESIDLLKELAPIRNDQDAIKVLGPTLSGYPVSYQLVVFIREYCNFLIDQFNKGNRVTEPHYLWAVDRINPAPIHYTKPILLLINALDFSGGDFFPAIMQDNKRAVIMGTTTAGAGGYVLEASFPNAFGIETVRYTGSIAVRIDGNPIENLGVTPDIPYSLTLRDLRNNFIDYKNAINTVINEMVK